MFASYFKYETKAFHKISIGVCSQVVFMATANQISNPPLPNIDLQHPSFPIIYNLCKYKGMMPTQKIILLGVFSYTIYE